MLYRTYGKTGIEVSALGMGCMRFESPDRPDEMAQVAYRAFERGVTYFDTAPFYCGDKSEDILGLAVREMKRTGRPFRIATKTMESKEEEIRAQLERSLKRLNVDAIDFYHVWCLVHPNQLSERKKKGVLTAFRKLKEEGLIRHICVSTHLEHTYLTEMFEEDEGLFEGILIGLNAVNSAMRVEGAREAARRGLGVVTMNTLGGGLITRHEDHFAFLRRPGDRSVLDGALRFNLSLPEVTVALVGFRNQADVDSAVESVERFEALSTEEIEATRNRAIASSQEFCTQCNYCRDCRAGIPVLRFMESYNRRILAKDDPKPAIDQLKWHWGIEDANAALASCTQCGYCQESCTQHLPILSRFEQLRADQAKLAEKKAAEQSQ